MIDNYLFPTTVSDLYWKIEGVEDFSGDGKSDILWRYSGGDHIQGWNVIWFMDGDIKGFGYPTPITKLGWKADCVGTSMEMGGPIFCGVIMTVDIIRG